MFERKTADEVEQWWELDAMKDPNVENLIRENRDWLPQIICSILEQYQKRGTLELPAGDKVFGRVMRLARLTISALNERARED
jgi:hypothetical protein